MVEILCVEGPWSAARSRLVYIVGGRVVWRFDSGGGGGDEM
jgi:hypothetical protein